MYSLVNRQTILSNKAGFGLSAAGWALPSMLPREEIALNGYEGGGKRKNVRKSSAEPTAVDDGPALPHESSCYHEIRRAEEKQRALWYPSHLLTVKTELPSWVLSQA